MSDFHCAKNVRKQATVSAYFWPSNLISLSLSLSLSLWQLLLNDDSYPVLGMIYEACPLTRFDNYSSPRRNKLNRYVILCMISEPYVYIVVNNIMQLIMRFQRHKMIKAPYHFIKQTHGMLKCSHKHQWHNNTLPNKFYSYKAHTHTHTHTCSRARARTNTMTPTNIYIKW